MTGVVIAVLVFFLLVGGLGGVAYLTYEKKLRRAKAIERGLKMVPILIHLPPPSSDTQGGTRDVREVMREKTAQAEVLYNLLAGTATEGFKSKFYGQRHIALELVVANGLVHFFAAVPVALVGVVKQAVITAYPGARLEEVEDHNIFNQEGRLAATLGGEMVLRNNTAYPIATYGQLERDPMEAILTAVASLQKQDGVAIQIMLRPAGQRWVKRSVALADNLRKGKSSELKFTAMDLAKAALKAPAERREEERAQLGGAPVASQLQLSQVERIEEKTKHPGFEVLVRVIVSTGSVMRSQQLLREISTAFALYESPGLNGFKFLPAVDVQGLVTAFIFRFFPNELKSNILNSAELATLFHLPDSQFTPSASVERQQSKQVDGPVQLPTTGLMFGYNEFRDARKEIRLSAEDRRRHTYILGQTGTGKSTMLENLAVQDMLAGNGFAFIDPHGDSAEKLLGLVPKERAEDVIYFNPADTQYPLGLNLFEFTDPAQKDFLVQETINMLYKLYDPGHTGIIGPRYEHWYRNAALTLMADPNGSTFIEIPKVFTDTEYLKNKFKYLKDPTVIDFWTKEMGQTSDYHKSEMLGWFVSKFGAFQNNEIMRNIIGQTKSSFNIRDIMDQKKILIVNLSKGRIGELNSQLLGMIFVIKFQAAAMSRADIPEAQRTDFALYVDEFQNFSTDSFASILSEARKYRLNLIVANQFIGQLSNEVREAVFGNIGTIVAHRMGPDDAEFMVKQFAPVFDAGDLVNIPNYHAAMRMMIGGLPSQPFTIVDSAPLGTPNPELGVAIKQLSAAKYGHNKATVEADLAQRLTGQAAAAGSVAPIPAAPATPATPVPAPAAAVAPTPAAPAPAAPATVMPSTPAPAAPSPVVAEPGVPAAPAVPSPAPAAPSSQMVMTPPPIGAPPVDISAVPADKVPVNAAAPTDINMDAMDAAPAANEPVAEPEAATPAAPSPAPAAAPGSQMVMTPPPIGAPPIDIAEPAAAKPVQPQTLSLDDITGNKKKTLVEKDPYASIDVLGPSAPRPASPVEETLEEAEPESNEPEVADVTVENTAKAPVNDAAAEKPAEDTDNDEDLTDGLPEGVHILEPTAPKKPDEIKADEVPVAAQPTPVAPVAAAPVAAPSAAPVDPMALSAQLPAENTPVTPVSAAGPEPVKPVPAEPSLAQATTEIVPNPAVMPNMTMPQAPAPVAEPQPAPDAAAPAPSSPISKAEHEIDDLLSVSLIHPDRRSPRLDSAAANTDKEASGSPRPVSPGMRVIQPLKPIEPAKGLDALGSSDKPAAEPVQPATPARPSEPTISELQHGTGEPVAPPSAQAAGSEPSLPVAPPNLAGTAIMPQAPSERPETSGPDLAGVAASPIATPATPADKPTLAAGEVSVDENGNVVIG